MAVYKIFPIQDATIYSAYPAMNTGLDEILEATTDFKTGIIQFDGNYPQSSRFLIQFDTNEMSYINNFLIKSSSWTSNLRLFVANSTGLSNTTTVLVNAISQSWEMGTGHYMDDPETQNGASWRWRTQSGSNAWLTSGFGVGSTGSYNLSTNPSSSGGGVWWTGSQASQSFSYYSDLDLNFNVKEIVNEWLLDSATYGIGKYGKSRYGIFPWSNYGFIVRQDPSQEFVNNYPEDQTTLQYFSRDTHTIYPPCLEFKWDDFVWNTGSSNQTIITNPQVYVSLEENSGIYYSDSIQRFRLNVRPQYPTKAYQTSSIYTNNYYLPTASYYAIKDLDTNEYVIDFDTTYTKISADSNSNYFDIYMNGLEPERYYTILVQTTIEGTTKVLNNNYLFKVING